MSQEPVKNPGNGVAVGLSVAAAGIVGAAGATLLGCKPSSTEKAQSQVTDRLDRLESLATQSFDQLVQALDGIKQSGSQESTKARSRASRLSKSATRSADSAIQETRRRIADIDREAMRLQAIEGANSLGHAGSQRAADLAQALSQRSSQALAETRDLVPQWKTRVSRTAFELRAKAAEAADQARASMPDSRERVTNAAADLAARGGELAEQALEYRPALLDTASKALSEAAEKGSDVATQLRDKSPEFRDRAARAAHDVSGQVKEIAPDVRDRAAKLAAIAAERAPEVAESVGTHLSAAVHSAQEHATPLVEEASAAIVKAAEQAREAGKRAGETLVPEVQHSVSSMSTRVGEQGQAARSSISALATEASDRISTTGGVIEHKSKAAASAAGRGSMDLAAFVGWSAAAAGVVYYALMNGEQREKLKQSAGRIGAEIRDIYQDIRGYDGEFN
jgi:gas vesicle protein